MHRIRIDAWLSQLDDELDAGRGADPAFLAQVREQLETTVVAENVFDRSYLRLELQDLERYYGVRLRDDSAC